MNQINKLREISVEERWSRRPSCPLDPCSKGVRMFGSSRGGSMRGHSEQMGPFHNIRHELEWHVTTEVTKSFLYVQR